MRGRNRNHKSHSGGGGGGGGGGHHHNPLTRVYESNGPEVKIRGTAHHIAEKYLQLARDAQSASDPVTAENYFQHAEHYSRLIATAQEQFKQQNPYYQAPPAPGQNADEAFDGDEDDGSQPTQIPGNFGQSAPQPSFNPQSQPQPSFNNTQGYGGQQHTNNNQQPNYQPREQAQPYGGQQPNYQPRPQQQPYNNSPPQAQPQAPQYQQPQAEPSSDGERLPSFITGSQSQPAPAQNGDDNANGERYPRHRRRRHRSGGPRPEMAGGAPQDFGGDTSEPGNS
jgi:hypothetical protein